ncbi:MAG: LegC family aminotransferase [Candidatus Omnitrophica bacterium]|nr:LegC family aminotransferase [Candidatus Omnitrophota bacterium]
MPTVRACTSSEPREGTKGRWIPLSEPHLAGNEWRYLKECLDSGWISSAGPFVERFEQAFTTYIRDGRPGTPAVGVVNGTAGLHVALRAALVQPDDEVLVPTLTFIAPVNAIRYCQAHPVFIDADPLTWQIDVKQVEAFLERECEVRPDVPGPGVSTKTCWNKRTKRCVRAIIPVHLLGLACDMEPLMALARRYHLRVVEDACEAIGVRYGPFHVGTRGHLGVFSFNGNKTLTCGGGGMVVARKPYADYVRYLTTQARDGSREYYHQEIGYNYRLTNLHAAIGLAQLEQAERLLARKRAIAAAYEQALRDVDGITLMPAPPHTEPGYWLYTILLREGTTVAQRNAVLDRLAAEDIEARPLWQPIHTQPPYQGCQRAGSMTVANDVYERAVSLPSSVGLNMVELERCVEVVRRLLAGA